MSRFMKKKAASNDVSDFGGIASSEEEEEEQEEEEEVMYEVPDCEGMTVHDPPLKYIAVKKGAVRIEASLESEKIPYQITKKSIVEVNASVELNGILRVRFKRGWTSVFTGRNSAVLMINEEDDTQHLSICVKLVKVRKEPKDDGEEVAELKQNDVIKVLEEPESAPGWFRIGTDQFVQSRAIQGTAKKPSDQTSQCLPWNELQKSRNRAGAAAAKAAGQEEAASAKEIAASISSLRVSKRELNKVMKGLPKCLGPERKEMRTVLQGVLTKLETKLEEMDPAGKDEEEDEPPEPEPEPES